MTAQPRSVIDPSRFHPVPITPEQHDFMGRSTGAPCECGQHKANCLFGEPTHHWNMPWFVGGRIARTVDTSWCSRCQAVCTGDEAAEHAQEPRECRTCGEPADTDGRIEHRLGTPCTTDHSPA